MQIHVGYQFHKYFGHYFMVVCDLYPIAQLAGVKGPINNGLDFILNLTPTANRTEPNFADVFQAFRDLGINLSDLAEFTREVESLPPPEPIPRYPVPRSSTHIYHAPSGGKPATAGRRVRTGSLSSEDETDRDHIPPYLPPLPLEAEEEKGTYGLTLRELL